MHIVYKDIKPKEKEEEQGSNSEPPYKAPGCTHIKPLPTLEELDR